MKHNDQYFNGIADKFAKNIYGTSKGRLRHQLLVEALSPWLSKAPMRILEVGGGTGIMTRELLVMGHDVLLTDASEDILGLAREMLAEYTTRPGQLEIMQIPLWELEPQADIDLVVCHAVLEWLENPLQAIEHLYSLTPAGKRLSLSFFNRDAALFGNVLYGNFDYIARGMKVKNQVRLNPQNPVSPQQAIAQAEKCGFVVEQVTGIRCFHDYLKERLGSDEAFEQLLALERQYNRQPPFSWLGKYLHLMLHKPA
ncbi:methyltransferase domain-containing protein [Alteromonas aestuariivivens]|uniref:tRNA 5-carboxymethoxyuridine methyltransferase n=1 Tax=Alteromonas aestuariivivens TaxID=1938339 RepID=A0A3D8M890_9ALTE|nr:methyltransferase domain-containing protein [Alteromonas aestuariivivens]RDV26034.1 methyltransferase domain-containing protein [Alteromonas aestuariivivens]